MAHQPPQFDKNSELYISIGRLMDADFSGVINHSGVAAACSSSTSIGRHHQRQRNARNL
jgi:hypothetical protein